MPNSTLSVREIQASDIQYIVNYWHQPDHHFIKSMGVDITKIPTKEALIEMLQSQIFTPIHLKKAYCIIWLLDNKPIGHCNTNPTFFGDHAFMHLHIWNAAIRKIGLGEKFIGLTLPLFFENLQLKYLLSEPYALNTAPNKTLEKLGFEFVKEYTTVPGSINFEQPVKQWVITKDKLDSMKF